MNVCGKFVIGFMVVIMSGVAIPAKLSAGNENVIELKGITTPYLTVDIGSSAMAVLNAVHFKRSDRIKKGDVVATMDARVESARMELAQGRMEMLDALIALQQERYAFAKREHERKLSLFQKGALPLFERDEAETNLSIAEKNVNEAMEQKRVAGLELKLAQEIVRQLTVTSPIDGIVVERFLDPGELVNEEPILQVAQLHPLNVEVIVPVDYWGKIKTGMPVEIIPEIAIERTFKGSVTIVDHVIDARSATFGIRVELANPDYTLPAGLNCVVRIHP
ncbi:MAG: efflux RND transporter periplasmic adaptor subunit [bacterium]|jgi:RND family efflux transporter MFP subunit